MYHVVGYILIYIMSKFEVNQTYSSQVTAIFVWDTGDWNATLASHSNQIIHLQQGMHPQLGHSMGSPDAHLGATAAALGGVAKEMP